ncbi:MAG: DNA phosphorothioation-associated putative methyltransferase [Crocosphaera sp.]|nr:DNA phosphorothioation-associated putative methyltransferase [Crocosphaera sp.]
MFLTTDYFNEIITCCKKSSIGKQLPTALYVHGSAITSLDITLQEYEKKARLTEEVATATIIKFNTDKPIISYLFYPQFDTDPHPALTLSIVVNLDTEQVSYWDYKQKKNPPILHRKETFITSDYPHYEMFAHLTKMEEELELLTLNAPIGTKQEWEKRLNRKRIIFEGHYLACNCPIFPKETIRIQIERHKAAIVRNTLSRPVRLALDLLLFDEETTFFDYGCGYGGDVERIAEAGYKSQGWDPYYCPDNQKYIADVVNIGYVINVIEDVNERREALLNAWELTNKVLIVSAQVLIDDRDRGVIAYGDGIITNRNTFQKYYEQEELKFYIDQVLEVDSIPIGLGIYLVFRDEIEAQKFRASRFHSRAKTPRLITKVRRFEDYEHLLKPLMEFYTERGRLPAKGELKNEEKLKEEFRSFRQAFKVILQVTEEDDWDMITEKRRQDLLLYLALSQFDRRPKMRELSPEVKQDIKALFGSYNSACIMADAMLYQVGNLEIIAQLCQKQTIGRKLRNSLLIHISALENLEPLLRLYEGCASRTAGRLEEANIIQFSWRIPKITYLFYPDFDNTPHPPLHSRMQIQLSNLRVNYSDYTEDENPPILHYKDSLVSPEYPLYETFKQLTEKEKELGLLDDYRKVNHLQGWLNCLKENNLTLEGHELKPNTLT